MSEPTTIEDGGVRADWLATVERFVSTEVLPNIAAWEDAQTFPRELYAKAASIGLLGLGYPEALGGSDASQALRNATTQLFCRLTGSGGLLASLFSHNIGLPPVLAHGSPQLQASVIAPVLRGEKIAALAITEPGGGSDVSRIKTTAVRDGDDYVVNGEKVFITSGMRADFITMAVRTDASKGAGGLSMLVVPGDSDGLSRTALYKMGWHCSDTAHLRMSNVRVPVGMLVGQEGGGFRMVMHNFNAERLAMSAGALGFAQACLAEALDWAQQRKTFGNNLVEHQVIRHKLADMQMRVFSTQAWLDAVVQRADTGDGAAEWVAQVCLLKNHATQTMQFCADQSVQILGGMGFMRGTMSERIYREVKVMMIGGGAEEIMKELATKQLGWV